LTKLLISGCLFGNDVRYDGKNSSLHQNKIFEQIKQKAQLIPFCPEVEGGLPTPRPPSEIQSTNPYIIKSINGEDTTKYFIEGARKTLELCLKNGIEIALLKSKSPSCSNDTTYSGKFNKKMLKQFGVTAELLIRNNIQVFNENELEKLLNYINK